jgi:predicted AlkP superfamily phosphohydrolase/phosphomutase
MAARKRTVIIGLDGVPFDLLNDLARSGIMPNTKRLIDAGTFRKMRSSIPEVSSVAWSSIITGVNPAEHGIFGFTDLPQNTYRLSFPNFDHLKARPFWEKGIFKRSIVLNVPSTYPARELKGILVSGFVALDIEKAVYPDNMISRLRDGGYRIDVDSAKAHQSLELFIEDLKRTNEARIAAAKDLWDDEWDIFMLVFTGSDRLMHFLWEAYEDKGHRFHNEFMGYFGRVDEAIGEITSKLGKDDNLLMLSDHGFERLEYDAYVNYMLKREGFLIVDSESPKFSDIDQASRAFALDPARIYINFRDKYPRGSVEAHEREGIIHDLTDLFKNWTIEGRKVVKSIYRKEELYSGPHLDKAPDIVLVGAKGFNLKAAINARNEYSKGIFTGKHTQHDAFLFLNKDNSAGIVPDDPSVFDVSAILDKIHGGMDEHQAA